MKKFLKIMAMILLVLCFVSFLVAPILLFVLKNAGWGITTFLWALLFGTGAFACGTYGEEI